MSLAFVIIGQSKVVLVLGHRSIVSVFFLALKEKLLAPAQYPGCSGSRNIKDNISDLKAQVAANHKVKSRMRAAGCPGG